MSAGLEHYRLLEMKLDEIRAKYGEESAEEDLLLDEMDHVWHQLTDEEWEILRNEK